MSSDKFYKELYNYLDREDVSKREWTNLLGEESKNIDLELFNMRESEKYTHTSEEKECYPLRLKRRLKRLLISYEKTAESCFGIRWYKYKTEPNLAKMKNVCDAL